MVHQSFWIPSRDLLTNGVCLTRMIAQAVLILNDMVSIIQVGWNSSVLLLSAQFWSSCHGSSVARSTTRDAGDSGSLRKQWLRDNRNAYTPQLANANFRYQEALDWRKWTKGGFSFRVLLLSAQLWIFSSSCHGSSFNAGPGPGFEEMPPETEPWFCDDWYSCWVEIFIST